jgi:VanZ family protein
LPAILWVGVVLFIGGRSNVPSVETGLPLDKVAHFVLYGLLGALATRGWLQQRRPRRVLWVLLACVMAGAVDEIHQRWVPNRSSDPIDWLTDVLGIGVAAALVLRFGKSNVV